MVEREGKGKRGEEETEATQRWGEKRGKEKEKARGNEENGRVDEKRKSRKAKSWPADIYGKIEKVGKRGKDERRQGEIGDMRNGEKGGRMRKGYKRRGIRHHSSFQRMSDEMERGRPHVVPTERLR